MYEFGVRCVGIAFFIASWAVLLSEYHEAEELMFLGFLMVVGAILLK